MIREKDLPDGWFVKQFVECIEKEASSNKLKIQKNRFQNEGEHAIIDQSVKYIAGYTDDYSKLYKGDLPVIIFGDHTRIFKFVDFPFALGADGTKILVPKKNILYPKYFYYFLLGERIENHGYSRHYKFLKEKRIVVPPLQTQKKIVAILEKAERLKGWRKEADELTDEFLKSTFLEMFGDPVTNPKNWDLFKFSKIGSLQRGKSKHRPRNAPELLGGIYPLIQTGNVANSRWYIREYDQTYSELGLSQSKMWPAETLCITIAANIAKTGILTFDACFPDSIVGFKPNKSAKVEYVQFWLSFLQKMLEDIAPESAQKNINLKILSNLNVPLPPLELQQKFAFIVQQVEQMREHQNQSRQHIDDLFNVLMQKAFKGELM